VKILVLVFLQEDISKVDNALGSIVRSLARQIEERKLALELLLELSKSDMVCNLMGNIQGSIVLLVTMLKDDVEAAKNAQEVLDNLSFLDQNVIEMAKANYLKPILQNLFSYMLAIRDGAGLLGRMEGVCNHCNKIAL
jgi:hypothetical protein